MQTSEERLLALELRGHVWMFRCPAGQEEALRTAVADLALRGDLDPLAASVVKPIFAQSLGRPTTTPDRTTCTNQPQPPEAASWTHGRVQNDR